MPRARKSRATALRKTPRQARSRATVDAILDATARVLVRRGFAGTNTNVVAEIAGVSVGSLYQYFPSKEALVAALHQRHAEQILGVLRAAFDAAAGRSLEATVHALVRAVIDAHLLDPDLHRVLEGEAGTLDDEAGEIEGAIFARVRALLAAHRDEVAPRDLDLAAAIVMRIVEALVHGALVDAPEPLAPRVVEREVVRAALGYLGRA
jgi:AcrR family transcriptional regulator